MEYYDVCVIGALYEEANAFIEVLKTHGTQPEEIFIPELRRTYYRANMQNIAGETLNIAITWLPDIGTINIMADFGRFLDHFPIRFAAMTGICAGNKDKVKLGDLIIANRTYLYDAGSNVIKDEGESEHKWDTKTTQITNDILQAAQIFTKWKEEARQIPRPYSKHQQRDWLLYMLFKENKTVYDIDTAILRKHAPDWKKFVWELLQGSDPFLDEDTLALLRPERVRKLLRGPVDFPYEDPSEPAHYIAPMASSNAVRKDNPFSEITIPVSKALAIDIESTTFDYTLQEHFAIPSLIVKGVCDYADKEKDDSYYNYAATISATYLFAFIKEFVTSERMPWPTQKVAQMAANPATPIQAFLQEAGFRLIHPSSMAGFMALPGKPLWRRHFPRGLYIFILLDKALDQSTVNTIYEHARNNCDHALIIINKPIDLSAWGQINILRGENDSRRFTCLPIEESLILKGLELGQEPLTLQHHIDKLMGKGFDPYDVHNPVSGAISFFGRQHLTEQLLNGLRSRQMLGLFGIQKIGKSSVMQELQKRAEFPIAYVYLNMDTSLSTIYSRIVSSWVTYEHTKYQRFAWKNPFVNVSHPTTTDFDAATKSLLDYLKSIEEVAPLLGIFLDEIEHIMPSEGDEKKLENYVHLMDELRSLQQETNALALLVAGVQPSVGRYNYFWGTQKNPLYHLLKEYFLPPLEYEDCKNMILSLGLQINLSYEEDALKYILALSGAHPYVTRQLCSKAHKWPQQSRKITAELVKTVAQEFIRNPATASYFNETGLWKELGLPETWGYQVGQANQHILLKLAATEQDLSESDLSASSDKPIALTAFYALKERSIISSTVDGKYRITIGLFKDWIRFHLLGLE